MKANWRMPWSRPALALLVAAAVALSLHLTTVSGQTTTFNEREVKSEASPLDDPKLDVWALDFRFKDPRLIKVNVPGRGTRICWYLWYQVINRTKEPRLFIPDFELVTLDNPGVYRDEILPSVQDAIAKIEDPTGYQKIKNSVTISNGMIPVSRPVGEAFPTAITGVAIWDGSAADEKVRDSKAKDLSDSTRFSIFVSGLSNGWVLVDPIVSGKSEAPIIRRKTLQLNFKRLSDRFSVDSRDIHFQPPAEWIYWAAQIRIPTGLPKTQPPPIPQPGPANGKVGAAADLLPPRLLVNR